MVATGLSLSRRSRTALGTRDYISSLELLALLECLWEELPDRLLLEAGLRTDASITGVVEHGLGRLRDSTEVPLLLFLFLLRHDVCQLNVPLITHLTCEC